MKMTEFRNMWYKVFVPAVLLCAINVLSFGATLRVPQNYLTVQSAINTSSDGDEIIVSPGTYKETLQTKGKNIALRSTDPSDTDTVKATIIDANYLGAVLTLSGTETNRCSISGLTLKNGKALDGGGIRNANTAIYNTAIIQNNIIASSSASEYGGGIFACNGIIRNKTITQNTARNFGGGLYDCNGLIINNTVSKNIISGTADTGGAGLSECDGEIKNNLISGNSATTSLSLGGGLQACSGLITENTITGNSAYLYGGGLSECNGMINNNIISQNSSATGGGLYKCNKIEFNTIQANYAFTGGGLANCQTLIQNNIVNMNTAGSGGGFYLCNGTIQNNTITNNSTYTSYSGSGGGLYQCNGIIQNNKIKSNWSANGGGLFDCSNSIRNNLISANSGGNSGGLYRCHGTIEDNIISDNSANNAGGIFECNGKILRNIISANSSSSGGGIDSCKGLIQGNLIFKNWAGYGGAFDSCPDATIINNTIYANLANVGGDFYNCKTSVIINCIIWGNNNPQIQNHTKIPTYSCIENWTNGGDGNIASEPGFIDVEHDNYYLADTSPCIDTGSPEAQYADNCFPPGHGTLLNDIGAFGGALNCGWDVKAGDLSDYVLGRIQSTPQKADSNGDGITDIADIVFYVNNF